jgi:SPP1 family phage portal protein
MELLELQTLLPEFDKLYRKILATKVGADNIATYQKQYDPKKHDVTDNVLRPDKIATSTKGTKTVYVARLPIPMQKKIVMLAAAFLCGNPIELDCAPADEGQQQLLDMINKTWKDNKLKYRSKELAKLMMSETEAAEIWYWEDAGPEYWMGTPNEASKKRLRVKIIANKYGDKLYPVFNMAGDMIAFARGYFLKEGEKTIEHFDVYMEDKIIKSVKDASAWISTEEPNEIGKIPVIYYSQEIPEWDDVQPIIDRWEKSISNHGDTNDYNGSPIVLTKGEIEGFADKGEQGKVLKLKGDNADAKYLTWDQAPASIELEQKNLRSIAYNFTATPDISLEQMKSLGTFSGIALKMLFMDAHLNASDKEETFGIGIQRRINFLKAAMAKINVKFQKAVVLDIEPKFEYYLPKDVKEMIDILSTATNSAKLMSQETAVGLNPLVSNPEEEKKRIGDEAAAGPEPTDNPFGGVPVIVPKTKPTNGVKKKSNPSLTK